MYGRIWGAGAMTPASVVIALLHASGDALSEAELLAVLAPLGVEQTDDLLAVRQAVEVQLSAQPIELKVVASGWRLQVRASHAPWVQRLRAQKPARLSRAALEVLAIIVHRQPVTRAEIESVRGVAVSSGLLASLKDMGWVVEAGVKPVPGRPVLWVTTDTFLDDLGLASREAVLAELTRIQQRLESED